MYAVQVIISIPLVILIYFNVRNIDFAQYLFDIMQGYGVSEYYEEGSIFIINKG